MYHQRFVSSHPWHVLILQTIFPGELHFPGLFAKTALGLFFLVENLDLHVDKQKQHRKQDYKVNPLLDHIKRDEKKKLH